MSLKYASVCSGIEAATVAWHPLGFQPVWFSQYDPEHNYDKGLDFPSEVLKHHYPQVPNLGDMLKIRDNEIYHNTEFDILVGGTPCQGFSIAGLRGGLDDDRSSLSLEFVRILDEKRPRWFVWENVPGVITSESGEGNEEGEESEDSGSSSDFARIISAFTGRDIADQDFEKAGIISGEFYSIAWRIFDSQYFGVPQRRRRIFVVGHIGEDWRPPFAVLFERDSLCRDFTPGGKKRKRAAGNTKASAGDNSIRGGYRQRGFGDYADDDSASALKKRDYKDATDLVVIENISNEPTAATITKQLCEQSGQDLGATGMLVVAEAKEVEIPIVIDRAAYNQGANALFDPKIEATQTAPPPH